MKYNYNIKDMFSDLMPKDIVVEKNGMNDSLKNPERKFYLANSGVAKRDHLQFHQMKPSKLESQSSEESPKNIQSTSPKHLKRVSQRHTQLFQKENATEEVYLDPLVCVTHSQSQMSSSHESIKYQNIKCSTYAHHEELLNENFKLETTKQRQNHKNINNTGFLIRENVMWCRKGERTYTLLERRKEDNFNFNCKEEVSSFKTNGNLLNVRRDHSKEFRKASSGTIIEHHLMEKDTGHKKDFLEIAEVRGLYTNSEKGCWQRKQNLEGIWGQEEAVSDREFCMNECSMSCSDEKRSCRSNSIFCEK